MPCICPGQRVDKIGRFRYIYKVVVSKPPPSLVWFRLDLRLRDNSALAAAIDRGGPVIPVFIWAPEEDGRWQPGAAARWWLHQSLVELSRDLAAAGSRLVILRGDSLRVLRKLAKHTQAEAVYWNRRSEPAAFARDAAIGSALRKLGLVAESFNAGLLFEPDQVRTRDGRPFRVFTPFWRACLAQPRPAEPASAPRRMPSPSRWPAGLALPKLQLQPRRNWASGLRDTWHPGSRGARLELDRFLDEGLAEYPRERDRPDHVGTSRLSPHLHWGEISPRCVWHAIADRIEQADDRPFRAAGEAYQRQLIWREFAHHLLQHFPHTVDEPLREDFACFPWRNNSSLLKAWQRGRTGYPLVDAGMRELWATGWMHNRVRMIVASFLVKHLLMP